MLKNCLVLLCVFEIGVRCAKTLTSPNPRDYTEFFIIVVEFAEFFFVR